MRTTKKKRGSTARKLPQAILERTRPAFITPTAAQVVKRLPEGDGWTHELMFDGYRALVIGTRHYSVCAPTRARERCAEKGTTALRDRLCSPIAAAQAPSDAELRW